VSADGYDRNLCDILPGFWCPLMGTTIHKTGLWATFVTKVYVVCAFNEICRTQSSCFYHICYEILIFCISTPARCTQTPCFYHMCYEILIFCISVPVRWTQQPCFHNICDPSIEFAYMPLRSTSSRLSRYRKPQTLPERAFYCDTP